MYPFILTLLATILLIPAIFAMPDSWFGRFYHSAWFWIPGGVLFAASLFGALMGLARRRWSSLVSHLGVLLLFIGLLRETKSVDGRIEVREGESTRTFLVGPKEVETPLGFDLALLSFQVKGYVSRVRFDGGPETRIAPSHPVSFRNWLILQDAFDQDTMKGWLKLVTGAGDTVRATLGERTSLPGTSLEIEFDQDGVRTSDTVFRFRLFEDGAEKPTGFVSKKGVIPPSLKLGFRLVESRTGGKYISILRAVRRPGAGLVFFAFVVMLVGTLMLAFERKRNPETIAGRGRGA